MLFDELWWADAEGQGAELAALKLVEGSALSGPALKALRGGPRRAGVEPGVLEIEGKESGAGSIMLPLRTSWALKDPA